jgi:hypothetical protein
MSSGDMWWARTTVTQTNNPGNPPGTPGPSFARKFVPGGIEFSGVVVGPTLWYTTIGWQVEIRSDYFLDPPRMPATGEPFISLPKMTFKGGLALRGGLDETSAIGEASCFISFRQILRWGDEVVVSSDVNWNMGWVRGNNVMLGKRALLPQKRDYGALFFNLDRTQTLSVTLVTTFRFQVNLGGVIAFAPQVGLVFDAPQWKVYSLD